MNLIIDLGRALELLEQPGQLALHLAERDGQTWAALVYQSPNGDSIVSEEWVV